MRGLSLNRLLVLGVLTSAALSALAAPLGQQAGRSEREKEPARPGKAGIDVGLSPEVQRMSAAGRMAYIYQQVAAKSGGRIPFGKTLHVNVGPAGRAGIMAATGGDACANYDEDCGNEGYSEAPSGGQAEMAIAVDATGMNVVIGFNDTRGFSRSPVTVSGYAYSNDGGLTFTDGGQLPVTQQGSFNGTTYPQVFGDPDIKYVPGGGGCQFIYSSILMVGRTTAPSYVGTAQTMGIHRSTDCGHTWQGPFEVTAATNPSGLLSGNNARDAADKEFIDVDPDSGRVMLSWTNFSVASQIRTSFSDNIMSATPPTWSPSVQLDTSIVQGSVPRFAGNGSPNAYVSWYQFAGGIATTKFARSTDNGASFGLPITLSSGPELDYILGNDRVHSFPIMAVDTSTGPYSGNIYIVNNYRSAGDAGADVFLSRSSDGGLSFQPAVKLNPAPGTDRSQWFPHVAVDGSTGRVHVLYYDQSVASSGDLIDMTWSYSDDGGTTWSRPGSLTAGSCVLGTGASDPLNCRPFHAGYGNDAGQPNLGDYNAAVAQGGTLYATWAGNARRLLFTDLQPLGSWPSPDLMFNKGSSGQAALRPLDFSFTDSGGNGIADAGDQIRMLIPLSSFATNPLLSSTGYSGITGTLSSSTPGVSFQRATVSYPDIAAGGTASNSLEYVFTLAPSFVPGTKVELALNVSTAQGTMRRLMTMNTGTPVGTTLFSEDFNAAVAPALPAGWGTIHQGGANTVPWATNNSFCGAASNGLYHINAEDGVAGNSTRFERAVSPNIVVPGNSQYVTVEFDICYNTEDAAQYGSGNPVLAYDGAHLRITDVTPGRLLASGWVEAFSEEFTTGNFKHFPKHAPRSSNPAYFQDISMWAGNSGGFKHVKMRFPGMQGSTFQLRPDYTQDANGICATPPCGVIIDNIVVKSFVTKSDELKTLTLKPVVGAVGSFTGTVTSQPLAPAGGIVVNLSSSNPGITTITPSTVTIPAGSQTSPSFNVTVNPATIGTNLTITATGQSNARSAGISIR